MSRLLLATFLISVLSAGLAGQSPAPTSTPQTVPKSSAQPTPSPSATPTLEELVDSLGPADLQAFITLLKANFTEPDAITDTELSRATVEGLLVRLPRGITLLPGKENVSAVTPSAFYSELIGGRTGYVRLGALNNANLQALDKALSGFAAKKVNDLIVDLRATSATNDLSLATEFAKRFCPKGKPIFTLRKPTGRQDRVFSSDREPAFRGLVMVLADSDTTGVAEAIAAALRFHNKALIIGQPTAGRAGRRTHAALPSVFAHAGRHLSKPAIPRSRLARHRANRRLRRTRHPCKSGQRSVAERVDSAPAAAALAHRSARP